VETAPALVRAREKAERWESVREAAKFVRLRTLVAGVTDEYLLLG